jgi:hypothetical protein
MSTWRKQLWVKIVALTVAGVFLFSEVTWAARANFTFSLPQAQNYNPFPSQGNWRDKLWQIYQDIASFLVPAAYADEITTYNRERYNHLPEYNPNLIWKSVATAVILPEEGYNEELEDSLSANQGLIDRNGITPQHIKNKEVTTDDTVNDTVEGDTLQAEPAMNESEQQSNQASQTLSTPLDKPILTETTETQESALDENSRSNSINNTNEVEVKIQNNENNSINEIANIPEVAIEVSTTENALTEINENVSLIIQMAAEDFKQLAGQIFETVQLIISQLFVTQEISTNETVGDTVTIPEIIIEKIEQIKDTVETEVNSLLEHFRSNNNENYQIAVKDPQEKVIEVAQGRDENLLLLDSNMEDTEEPAHPHEQVKLSTSFLGLEFVLPPLEGVIIPQGRTAAVVNNSNDNTTSHNAAETHGLL